VTARLVALTLLSAAVAWRSAAAQVGATTDIITGKVTGPDSQPLAGAVVVATSVKPRFASADVRREWPLHHRLLGRRRALRADGALHRHGGGPGQCRPPSGRGPDRGHYSHGAGRGAARARHRQRALQRASDRTGPGGSDRNYNPEQLARLPIDVSDVNTVATLQAGVLGIRGSDSTATAFSVAGQRPTAKQHHHGRMSFGSGPYPRTPSARSGS